MSSEWSTLNLEDCLDALIDYRGKTPEKTSFGVPLVTAKVIKGGRIETPTEFIAHKDYDIWMRRGIPKEGDVVMTTEAPLGEVAQLGPDKIALAQRVITLRGKKGFLDNTYLLYLLQTAEMQVQLKARASGTTVLGIKQKELRKISVTVPPMQLQKEAASILSTLDRRITLLRETDTTLASIAQALFKSWFVDFDPVRAKQEGRQPEGLDAGTAVFFSNTFEESELGLVPKGWEITSLNQIFTLKTSKVGDLNVPEYSSTNTGLQPRSELFKKQLSPVLGKYKLINKGDLVFGLSRQILNFGLMKEEVGCVSPAYKVFTIDKNIIQPDLLERMMRFHSNYFFNAISASSREGQSVSTEGLGLLKVVRPPLEVQRAFYDIVEPLYRKALIVQQQSLTLRSLRDTLLPCLISGQLRLPDAEALIDEAAA